MKTTKRIIFALLLIFALTFITGCSSKDESIENLANAYFTEYPETGSYLISWTDLYAKIDAGDDLFILDIRSATDYALGHIEGAMNAAWGTDLALKVSMLPTDEDVYVYCYTGQTAGQTIALLHLLGIEAYSVKSGFVAGGAINQTTYLTTTATPLVDANAKFEKTALKYVEDYFNDVAVNGSHIITSNDAKPLIESGDVTVIDIRSTTDFALGHIEGAINIPFGKGMEQSFSDLPEGRLLVACYSGQTAGQTIAILRAMGYQADSIKYGMSSTLDGWVKTQRVNAAKAYFENYPASGSYMITWTDLYALIDAEEEPFILDIRSAADYALGHIDGAMNAAWGTDLGSKVSMLPKDEVVYVYCYTGQTAGQTIALLRLLGIQAVSVKSGFVNGGAINEVARLSTDATLLNDAQASFDPFMLSYVESYFNATATEGSHIITAVNAKPLIDDGLVTVVDIRSAADYAIGHIDGAINIPFGINMQNSFSTLPAGQLLVACYSGQTAGQTIAILRAMGYQADSIKNGMSSTLDGWFHNFPLESE